ncbi:MAG: SpoIIE family protein phosphatase [Treponema sp.]|nr:SpoIIE family protein phosphatase [Treponema sp.]
MVTTINYKHLRREVIKTTVEFETEKVNKIIAEMERGAIYLATDGLLFYKSQSYAIGETSALEYLRSFPAAVGGGFWFAPYAYKNDVLRAGIYAYFDKTKGEVRLDDFIMSEYDYHSLNWYREIADAVTQPYQTVWVKPYIDDTSYTLMTTAGAGIFDRNGSFIGISIIDWEIDEVIKELTAIKPTDNSFVLLCVPEKDYIISSTRTNSVTGESIKSLPWDINADSFTLDNVNYIRFGRYMDNGWLLSIQIPQDEIFAEVESQNNRFSILIALSSVIMLCLAYYLISKLINAPIQRLISDVAQLAQGNLDIRIETISKDELGLLAQTFNKMTADLKNFIEENARERAEKERISAELSIATEIQANMLPCIFPPFPNRPEFDLYASMLPAKEVGGDFYDFFLIDKDNLAVIIADVSGKGIPAALFMVITKTLIKNCSVCKSPKNVFESVNNKLCEGNEANMFVTAFMGHYHIPSGRFVYVNAGHNPPLVKKHGGGYEFLKTDPCLILAWMKGAKYKQDEIILEPGDALYLYTDGVTEAMNPDRELFSEQRLLAALNQYRDSPPRELLYAIKQEIKNFTGEAEQTDDITMLALKISDKVDGPADSSGEEAMKELKVEARTENLDKVIKFVNTELEQHKCPPNIEGEIDLAVEEIFMNITNYAYQPERGNVAIFISVKDKALIKFEDTGRPYNPLEQPDPDLNKPLQEREPGGLGVFLTKKLMNTVEYTRVEQKNVLVMTKTYQL